MKPRGREELDEQGVALGSVLGGGQRSEVRARSNGGHVWAT